MDTTEKWRDVVGFEGKYRVISHGRVWSNRRKKYLTPFLVGGGYIQVILQVGGEKHTWYVHRLVMKAFSKDFSEGLQINHRDENKLNNRLDNLEMCTPQYNSEYSLSKYYIVTTPCGKEMEVFNLRKFCRENDVDQRQMHAVVTGRRKHCKGYKARYKE